MGGKGAGPAANLLAETYPWLLVARRKGQGADGTDVWTARRPSSHVGSTAVDLI